jgi:sec-independent protein translocase protein TatA
MHLLVLLIIALLVVGPKRLPGVGRAMGSGIREFRDGLTGRESEKPSEAPLIEPKPPRS